MTATHDDIRTLGPDDAGRLEPLVRQHAAFERAPEPPPDLVLGLRHALSREELWGWIAVGEDALDHDEKPGGDGAFGGDMRSDSAVHDSRAITSDRPVGYATVTIDTSTFTGERFVHLDCLFVTEGARNAGVGRRMMELVEVFARDRGIRQIRWQTPEWNTDAQRFYVRHGGDGVGKVSYTQIISR
jgi:GNAT superfamily N-acetyltransferase